MQEDKKRKNEEQERSVKERESFKLKDKMELRKTRD